VTKKEGEERGKRKAKEGKGGGRELQKMGD